MAGKTTIINNLPQAAETARAIAERHGNKPDALLEILHDLQEQLGFIPESALPALGKALNRTRAEIQGVVSFYHDFRRAPAGRHVVKICRAESCQAMGAETLVRQVEDRLQVRVGETTSDGSVTLEAVYCLGNCALSPAIMVDGRTRGRMDMAKFEKLAADLQA